MTDKLNITIGMTIYRIHSREFYTVAGETSRSWLLRRDGQRSWEADTEIPKRELPGGWTLSRSEWEDAEFAINHRWKIRDCVLRVTPQQLRQIADIIGYKAEPDK